MNQLNLTASTSEISRLQESLPIDDPLLKLMYSEFTEPQKRMFVESHIIFLKYDKKKDFVVELNEDLARRFGYTGDRKVESAKFRFKDLKGVEGIDYKIVRGVSQNKTGNLGGRPKECIFMNIHTYKAFCMIVNTPESIELRNYFVDMENVSHEYVNKVRLENESKLKLLLEEQSKLIAAQALEIKKKDEKLKEIKVDQDMYYYVLDRKLGICNNPEDTLKAYRRLTTKTSFDWLYKFKLPKNAKDIETIIKNILFNFREKINKDTEVFDLPQEKCLELVQLIIGIFDNPDSSKFKHIDDLIIALKRPNNDKQPEYEEIIKKLDEIKTTTNVQPPVSSSSTTTDSSTTTINNTTIVVQDQNFSRSPVELMASIKEQTDKLPIKDADNWWNCSYTNCLFKNKKLGILEQHIVSHLNIRPHKCPICKTEFKRKYDRDRHIRDKHTERKNFQCPGCEKAYPHRNTLKSHVIDKHDEIDPEIIDTLESI